MTVISQETSKGQLVAITFEQSQLAASQTDVQLLVNENGATSGTLAVDEYVMPFDGEVVGISYSLSAAGSAGSLTIGATLAGTENASTTQTVTTAQRGSAKIPRGTMPFSAGGRIGAEITTSGSWNGTTADLFVIVWVLQKLEGI